MADPMAFDLNGCLQGMKDLQDQEAIDNLLNTESTSDFDPRVEVPPAVPTDDSPFISDSALCFTMEDLGATAEPGTNTSLDPDEIARDIAAKEAAAREKVRAQAANNNTGVKQRQFGPNNIVQINGKLYRVMPQGSMPQGSMPQGSMPFPQTMPMNNSPRGLEEWAQQQATFRQQVMPPNGTQGLVNRGPFTPAELAAQLQSPPLTQVRRPIGTQGMITPASASPAMFAMQQQTPPLSQARSSVGTQGFVNRASLSPAMFAAQVPTPPLSQAGPSNGTQGYPLGYMNNVNLTPAMSTGVYHNPSGSVSPVVTNGMQNNVLVNASGQMVQAPPVRKPTKKELTAARRAARKRKRKDPTLPPLPMPEIIIDKLTSPQLEIDKTKRVKNRASVEKCRYKKKVKIYELECEDMASKKLCDSVATKYARINALYANVIREAEAALACKVDPIK